MEMFPHFPAHPGWGHGVGAGGTWDTCGTLQPQCGISKTAAFPCKTLQVQGLHSTQGFPLDGVRGKNKPQQRCTGKGGRNPNPGDRLWGCPGHEGWFREKLRDGVCVQGVSGGSEQSWTGAWGTRCRVLRNPI